MGQAFTPATVRQREKLRKLLLRETGIKLPQSKDVMVEQRLRRRVLEHGFEAFDDYLAWLFDAGGLDEEWSEIVDLLTTNKTDFYRESAHFEFLRDTIVPEALSPKRGTGAVRFRMWSAASSTGAEAWTAAMILAELAREQPRLDWAILGTDVSERVLAIANLAIYPATELAPLPAQLRDAYSMAGRGPQAGKARIVPELRARVRFEHMNLMNKPYPVQSGLDVAFLRNVLIYFEPDVQARVIQSIAAHLRPGGYLVVGHSESMTVKTRGLTSVIPGVFRKKGGE